MDKHRKFGNLFCDTLKCPRVFYFQIHFSVNIFSTLASFTQSTNAFAAASISSGVGKDGAIRMLESNGSLPYGYVAPAPVSTTPRALHFATIAAAQPGNASKEMK